MKMPWTRDEEKRLRQLLQRHARPDEIAKDLSRSTSAVRSKAHALGLTSAQIGNFRRRRLSKWG
jgi:Myb-like DNA-binding domain